MAAPSATIAPVMVSSIIGNAVPSARIPKSSAEMALKNICAKTPSPRGSAREGRLDAHRAGLCIGHRKALREADEPAGQEDQQRRELERQSNKGQNIDKRKKAKSN